MLIWSENLLFYDDTCLPKEVHVYKQQLVEYANWADLERTILEILMMVHIFDMVFDGVDNIW